MKKVNDKIRGEPSATNAHLTLDDEELFKSYHEAKKLAKMQGEPSAAKYPPLTLSVEEYLKFHEGLNEGIEILKNNPKAKLQKPLGYVLRSKMSLKEHLELERSMGGGMFTSLLQMNKERRKKKRKRRTRSNGGGSLEPTRVQREAFDLFVGKANGSYAEVQRLLGRRDYKTVCKNVKEWQKRLGYTIPEIKRLIRIPTDLRGQESIAGDDDGPASIRSNPTVKRNRRLQ